MTTAYIILGIWFTILIIGILNILINYYNIKDMKDYKDYEYYPINAKVKTPYGTAIITEDVGSPSCGECLFYNRSECSNAKCTAVSRKDNNHIIFKELE